MFKNRLDAGRQLAAALTDRGIEADLVVAIPRGGVPVGRAVADALHVPFDIVTARKLRAPGRPELAIGAVTADGTVWLNDSLIAELAVKDVSITEQLDVQGQIAVVKAERYRGARPAVEYEGRTVVLVDDGVATGATTIACIRQLKNAGAARVVLAVPVAPPETVDQLQGEADEVICVETPMQFAAVGQFYESFAQVSDAQVEAYLNSPSDLGR